MFRFRNVITEWKARRDGRKFLSGDLGRSAREVIGPTGNGFSNAWDALADNSDAYLKSFDPRVPPSLHVSQRDQTRHNRPIPLPERRIGAPADDDLTPEELAWGSQPPSADDD